MLATAMLEAGQQAPTFSLPDSDMETKDLACLIGSKNIVLYFYQRDGSPGCILEAVEFSDQESEFQKRNTVIMGISTDDCISRTSATISRGPARTLNTGIRSSTSMARGTWPDDASR